MILAETRTITCGHGALRRGVWRGDLYRADLVDAELSRATVGVIGYGHVGTKVVRLLKAFGSCILVAPTPMSRCWTRIAATASSR